MARRAPDNTKATGEFVRGLDIAVCVVSGRKMFKCADSADSSDHAWENCFR